jgi:tripartite ATP-independent transporter DctP family solute receptor
MQLTQPKWIGISLAVMIGSAGWFGSADAQVVKLRYGHIATLQHSSGIASTTVKRVAEELSKGTLQIELFPNAQLGGSLAMIGQVRLGSLDMVMTGSGLAGSLVPTFSITELPFIWKDGKSAWKVLNGLPGRKLLRRLEPKGIKGLAWGAWGWRGLLSNGVPINSPDDLKGMKVRIVENAIYVKTLEAFGANPVPMAWPEVYTALRQKAVIGLETNYSGMRDGKMYEVAKNLAVTNHIYTFTVFMINLDKFNSLSSDHQEILVEAARAGGAKMGGYVDKENQDAIDLMVKNGVKLTHPDRAAFASKIGPVHEHFAGIVGREFLEEIKATQR